MELEDCDALLGMPWHHQLRAVTNHFGKKITFRHRNKEHVLDAKLNGESIPVVSASAILH